MEVKTRAAVDSLILKLKTSSTLRERTIVSSFFPAVLIRVQNELPDVRTLLLVRWPFLRVQAFHQKLATLKPWGVAFRLRLIKPRLVTKLRRMGLQVGAWDQRGTVREARQIAKLQLDIAIVHHIRETRDRSTTSNEIHRAGILRGAV
jgi:glycerophosphoryl diester phosphodiesterase